ncbi:hypothetical protein ACL9RF_01165 [Sphingobacterium sp. Mn56C]|uniref:hypothetical protein n=1 Tax=Sphingobacterium sp. Mn56C TaxID=3395261 RepID=UPI003BEC0386
MFSKISTAKFRVYALATVLIFSFAQCSKDKTDTVLPLEPETSSPVPYYRLQRVENLAAETDDNNPTIPKKEVLYSLRYKKERPLTYAKTTLWDISFSDLYNSMLAGNNHTDLSNSGYGGNGKGGITVLEKAFDEVVDIPNDNLFKTNKAAIGPDDSGAFGTGIGWYLYDFGGSIVGDGSANKSHVSYALGQQIILKNKDKAPIRTVVLRLANGDYAKIKMISCYKDIYNQDDMFKDTPHMFFTFEYIIVPAGSTKFEIK